MGVEAGVGCIEDVEVHCGRVWAIFFPRVACRFPDKGCLGCGSVKAIRDALSIGFFFIIYFYARWLFLGVFWNMRRTRCVFYA